MNSYTYHFLHPSKCSIFKRKIFYKLRQAEYKFPAQVTSLKMDLDASPNKRIPLLRPSLPKPPPLQMHLISLHPNPVRLLPILLNIQLGKTSCMNPTF